METILFTKLFEVRVIIDAVVEEAFKKEDQSQEHHH
jgi:hypothetical protein